MATLPDIDSLRCFVAASKTLNFRAAARAVALTPAAFGQRIKQLEHVVGHPLFRRTTRSVALTEAGIALVPVAERCIEAAADCIRAAKGELSHPPMDLTLGTRQELGLSWVMPQFDTILKERPWLSLHLYFGSGPDLLLRVRTHEVDCAITSTRFSDPKLDSVPLHREDYVLCATPDLLKKHPLSKPEHAKAHTLLDTSRDVPLFRYFREAPSGGGEGYRFGNLVMLGGTAAIRERVLAHAGVAVLPRYLVADDLKKKRLVTAARSVVPLHDYFRLVFRGDDSRRALFESLAETLMKTPLR